MGHGRDTGGHRDSGREHWGAMGETQGGDLGRGLRRTWGDTGRGLGGTQPPSPEGPVLSCTQRPRPGRTPAQPYPERRLPLTPSRRLHLPSRTRGLGAAHHDSWAPATAGWGWTELERGRTRHGELCAGTLVDLCVGGQVDGPAQVDAAVVEARGDDAHVEVPPVGQPRDTEAPVPARLDAVLLEGGQLVRLVAGAQAVPVEHEAVGDVGQAAGERGVLSLLHRELRRGEGERAPGPVGGV